MRHFRFVRSTRTMLRRVGGLLAISVVAALQGCRDSEGPQHPIVGTYAVETTLERYVNPIGGCNSLPYCYEELPVNGATLSGTLYIPDTTGAFAEFDRHDPYQGQEGRLNASGPFWEMLNPIDVVLWEEVEWPTSYVALRSAKLEGDSIVGQVRWQVNSRHTYYYGTFVARRITGR